MGLQIDNDRAVVVRIGDIKSAIGGVQSAGLEEAELAVVGFRGGLPGPVERLHGFGLGIDPLDFVIVAIGKQKRIAINRDSKAMLEPGLFRFAINISEFEKA